MTYLDIDTLFISGGGLNCLSILGSLKYTIDEAINFFMKININDYLNNKISINSILNNYGIYDINVLKNIAKIMLKHKNYDENLTLADLHKITKKNILFKTINITKEQVIFIDHINYHDLTLSTPICMTCCAPIMFIPIKYKGDLYIDGGYCGNFPFDIEHKYKKYIGLNIMCNDLQYNTLNNKHNNHKINSISDYLRLLYRIFGIQVRRENKRIININIYESGLDFKKQNNQWR